MAREPFYMVLTADAYDSSAHPGTPAGFDNAVDEYSERADEGKESVVYLCDPAQNAMEDVTKDANATILRRCHAMRVEPPMWMLPADEQACRLREQDPFGAKVDDDCDRDMARRMEKGK